MAAVSVPFCPDCTGTGSINGAACYSCGDGAARARRLDWRGPLRGLAGRAATAAGTLVRWSSALPGVAGAAAVSAGAGWTAHAAWHPLPAWGVGLVVAGVFGLAADRRL